MIKVYICDNDYLFSNCLLKQLTRVFASLLIETEILLFASPEDCLSKIEQSGEPPDVVFLEIVFFGMTGFEFAKKIKSEYRETFVIFMSEQEELVFESFDYHSFSFVKKLCRDIISTSRQKKVVEICDIDAKSALCVSTEEILLLKAITII